MTIDILLLVSSHRAIESHSQLLPTKNGEAKTLPSVFLCFAGEYIFHANAAFRRLYSCSANFPWRSVGDGWMDSGTFFCSAIIRVSSIATNSQYILERACYTIVVRQSEKLWYCWKFRSGLRWFLLYWKVHRKSLWGRPNKCQVSCTVYKYMYTVHHRIVKNMLRSVLCIDLTLNGNLSRTFGSFAENNTR